MTLNNNQSLLTVSFMDFIMILAVMASAFYFLFYVSKPGSLDTQVNIYQENFLIQTVSPAQDQVFTVKPENSTPMSLEIKDHKIRVLNNDCPRHICQHGGWIQYSGEKIVCLPKKIIIEISDTESKNQFDAIT